MNASGKSYASVLPHTIWSTLSPVLQDVIVTDLTSVFLEVISDAALRYRDASSPVALGGHLHPPVNASPSQIKRAGACNMH
jgi:hypothetical protein